MAVDMALRDAGSSVGIGFYGGEPLLCKSLIEKIVTYAKQTNKTGKKVFFKLTSNGLLLDDSFLAFSKKENILISLSMDGNRKAHDTNRKDGSGRGSYQSLLPIIQKILERNRYTTVMMTVSPNTISLFHDSVRSIYALGFMNIVCSMDLTADWDEEHLAELKSQYRRLADLYYRKTIAEEKFFFSPFDSKINSHIRKNDCSAKRCKLGYEQISVAVDGALYPCVQFADNRFYQVGDVRTGIDENRRLEIYEQSRKESPECALCAIRHRCSNSCSCMNMVSSGDITTPSPTLCSIERMLVPIADSIAAKLYKMRSGLFIHKHYNDLYPLVSLMEDGTKN